MPTSLFEILFLLIAEQHSEQGVCVMDKAFFIVTMWYDKKRIKRKVMRGRQGQSWCGFIRITVITKVFRSAVYVGAPFSIECLKCITCTPEYADSKCSTGRKMWGPDAIASQAVMLPWSSCFLPLFLCILFQLPKWSQAIQSHTQNRVHRKAIRSQQQSSWLQNSQS